MSQGITVDNLGNDQLSTGYDSNDTDGNIQSCSAVFLWNEQSGAAGLYHWPSGNIKDHAHVCSQRALIAMRDAIGATHCHVLCGTMGSPGNEPSDDEGDDDEFESATIPYFRMEQGERVDRATCPWTHSFQAWIKSTLMPNKPVVIGLSTTGKARIRRDHFSGQFVIEQQIDFPKIVACKGYAHGLATGAAAMIYRESHYNFENLDLRAQIERPRTTGSVTTTSTPKKKKSNKLPSLSDLLAKLKKK